MNVIQRFFQSDLNRWKTIFVVLLFLTTSSGRTNFLPVNSCTDIKLKDIPVDVFQKCSETKSAIHCLPDENNNLGLSCFQVTWITEGKCPYYNSYQGNMDEKDCSTDYNGECPDALYKSPLSVKYTGCYIKELIARTTAPSMTTKTMTTMTSTTSKEPSSESMANDSLIGESTTETHQTAVSESGKGWMGAFIFILLLAVAMVAAVCIVYKRILCDKCKQTIRKAFRRVKPKFCCKREAQNADPQPQDRDDGSRKPMVDINASKCNGISQVECTCGNLILPSSTGKPNLYPMNSYTDIKLKVDGSQRCSETNSAIHCLPDENNNLGLSCFQVTWISKGKTDAA